jgi:hypothetical protein
MTAAAPCGISEPCRQPVVPSSSLARKLARQPAALLLHETALEFDRATLSRSAGRPRTSKSKQQQQS